MSAENESELPPLDPLLDDLPAPENGKGGFVPEILRKMAVAGLGALFMTEDGIRSLSGQLKIPKEVLGFVLSQAEKTKSEMGRVVSEELRGFLQSKRLREELLKLVSGMTVEVKAQIRLVPDAKNRAPSAPSEDEETTPPVVVSELRARRGKRTKKK